MLPGSGVRGGERHGGALGPHPGRAAGGDLVPCHGPSHRRRGGDRNARAKKHRGLWMGGVGLGGLGVGCGGGGGVGACGVGRFLVGCPTKLPSALGTNIGLV